MEPSTYAVPGNYAQKDAFLVLDEKAGITTEELVKRLGNPLIYVKPTGTENLYQIGFESSHFKKGILEILADKRTLRLSNGEPEDPGHIAKAYADAVSGRLSGMKVPHHVNYLDKEPLALGLRPARQPPSGYLWDGD